MTQPPPLDLRARRPARRPLVRAALVLTVAALVLSACHEAPRARPARRARPVQLAAAWSRPTANGPSDLAGDGDGVVVLSGHDRVIAFDASGHERWTSRIEGAGRNLQPPAIDRLGVAFGVEARLVVLDRLDGAARWQADEPAPVEVAVFAHPRGAEELVISSTGAGDLTARDANHGTPRWRLHEPGEVRSRLALDADERVVVALWSVDFAPVLRALDTVTGRILWECRLGAESSAPVVTRGLVVVGNGDGNFHASVTVLGLDDGSPRGEVAAPASFEPWVEPVVDGDQVVVIDHFGTVTAVDPVAGTRRWQQALGEPVLRTRVVAGPRYVAVSTAAGAVVWLDRRTGRVVRRLASDQAYATQVAGTQGRVVVAWRGAAPDDGPEGVEAYPL